MTDQQPVDPELFKRTAPRWNCVDFADGMHYRPADTCLWCGKSAAEIRAEDDNAGAFPVMDEPWPPGVRAVGVGEGLLGY